MKKVVSLISTIFFIILIIACTDDNVTGPEDTDNTPPSIIEISNITALIGMNMEINVSVYDSSGVSNVLAKYTIEQSNEQTLIMNRVTGNNSYDTVLFSGTIPAQENEVTGTLYFTMTDSANPSNAGNSDIYEIEWLDGSFIEGNAYLENSSIHDSISIHFERTGPVSPQYSKTVYSNNLGHYSRYLKSGFYRIIYSKDGYHNRTLNDVQLFSNTFLEDISLEKRLSFVTVPEDFSTIQSAINQTQNGDTILVAPGIYNENINFYGKNILLTSNYFLNNDTSYISQTIIKGDSTDSVIKFVNHENSETILEGFSITGGYSNDEDRGGGGILCLSSSPTLKNLKIYNNNSYLYGGGIYFRSSDSIVKDSFIYNNRCNSGGGGIYLNDHCNSIFENIRIESNSSGNRGGGIEIRTRESIVTFRNLKLLNNITGTNGNSSSHGGGLYALRASTIRIYDSTISGNIAQSTSSSSEGGAIKLSVVSYDPTVSIIDNVIISGNFADFGGGIYLQDNSILTQITNSTIVGNNCSETGFGSAIYLENSNPLITNSIISNNYGNIAMYATGMIPQEIKYSSFWNNEYGNFYNCGYIGINITTNTNQDSCDIYNNIRFDPQFVDQNNNDYHLLQESNCIDSGNNENVLSAYDFDGNDRIIDGNNDGDAKVDMGVYELDPGDKQPSNSKIIFYKK